MTISKPPIPESAWQSFGDESDLIAVNTPLIRQWEIVVQRQPQVLAIADSDCALTHLQLWNAVMRRAQMIDQISKQGDRIGIKLSVGVDLSVTILACLAAGRIAILLDSADPPSRTKQIVSLAGVSLVFGVGDEHVGSIPWISPGTLDIGDKTMLVAPADLDTKQPVFMVPTSGSTGTPKLIVHNQEYVLASSIAYTRLLGIDASDIVVFTGSGGSVAFIINLFISLISGGMTLLVDFRNGGLQHFIDLMIRYRASSLRITPSLARVMAKHPRAKLAFQHLRSLRFIGEPALSMDLEQIRNVLPNTVNVFNTYASTETLSFGWKAPEVYTGKTLLPAGKPQIGNAFVLLSEEGGICKRGEEGQLVMRSRYNALGEWQDGRIVSGRMIADADDKTVYYTGDLAVLEDDGNVTVLGRMDRQVKINGIRVGLAEIEEAIMAIPGISATAVVARRDPSRTVLFGFIVPKEEALENLAKKLPELLLEALPRHMIPFQFIALSSLPQLPSYKLDVKALLALTEAND